MSDLIFTIHLERSMKKQVILFLSLLLCARLQAQLPVVSTGSLRRLDSFQSKYVQARTVDVWLPEGYPAAGRYAVLYMHDGQMLFDSSITWNRQEWRVDETAGKLQAAGRTMPFIVVAIANGGKQRLAEFFPQKAIAFLPISTRDSLLAEMKGPALGDNYLRFLVTELKPYIDSVFVTHRDVSHTFLAGSSMGGLISLYGLCEYPQVFGGAACLSTHWPGSLQQLSGLIPTAIGHYVATHLPKAGSRLLYMDRGDKTLDSFYIPLQRNMDRLLKARHYQAPFFTSRSFPGADHSERSWAGRLEVPMVFLLRRGRP
jgi:enterochelin esterase-like enzyme